MRDKGQTESQAGFTSSSVDGASRKSQVTVKKYTVFFCWFLRSRFDTCWVTGHCVTRRCVPASVCSSVSPLRVSEDQQHLSPLQRVSPAPGIIIVPHALIALSSCRSTSCLPHSVAGMQVQMMINVLLGVAQVAMQKLQNSFSCDHFCFVQQVSFFVLTLGINALKSRAQYTVFVFIVTWSFMLQYFGIFFCSKSFSYGVPLSSSSHRRTAFFDATVKMNTNPQNC